MIYKSLFRAIPAWARIPGAICCLLFLASSCQVTRQAEYFETVTKDTLISGLVTRDFESKIQPGDQLSIVATSLSSVEDELFNKASVTTASPTMGGYTVQPDGKVLLHRLGNVQAAGLSRKQFSEYLQTALAPFMRDVIVTVNYINHKITVLGEVGAPQVLAMPEEQLSIIDVLVKSGDIKENGLKSQVLIVREAGNEKQFKFVNLQDHSIFTSPWYYVQPNDIILVRSDVQRLKNAEKRTSIQTTVALITSGITFIFFIIDRITR